MTAAALESLHHRHRRELWAHTYRMTGSASDADDVVQETFRRALEHPPQEPGTARAWLFRVATNLAVDVLRRRRAEPYPGPWLPEPVATDELLPEAGAPDARYEAMESVSFSFLLALEALEPRDRAVLLLRDVLGFSGPEVAGVLGITPGHVRVVLHRARERLAAYDARRLPPPARRREAVREALSRFLGALATGDVDRVAAVLAQEVRVVQDGGGFPAARLPVVGRGNVARFLLGLARLRGPPLEVVPCEANGLPALLVRLPPSERGFAPETLLQLDVDERGAVLAIHNVLAPRKLDRLRCALEGPGG